MNKLALAKAIGATTTIFAVVIGIILSMIFLSFLKTLAIIGIVVGVGFIILVFLALTTLFYESFTND